MQITCPACRKENIEFEQCQRCGCDLSPLIEILSQSQKELKRGIEDLSKKRGESALCHADRSWALKRNVQAARLGFLASLMTEDYTMAMIWYKREFKLHI